MIDPSRIPEAVRTAYKAQANARLEAMRNTRLSWWAHWAQLAEVFLPRRYKWFITPNQYNRGAQLNSAIVDETGVIAARTLAAGMMSGMTSPTRPWFRLGLANLHQVDFGPAKNWLAECERRMLKVMAESNFYQALAQYYHDLSIFGSSDLFIYEDPEHVITCYNPCLGEFFFDLSGNLTVDTNYREFTLTLGQTAKMFGLENLSQAQQQIVREGSSAVMTEVVVRHACEPNTQVYDNGQKALGYLVPPIFKFREAYWLVGSDSPQLLKVSGFWEKPFMAGRWDVTSNDPYGRSPGMDALPAVRQLQIEQRRKAEAIDKMVRPPMVASVNMKNEPMSILPGAVNYVADLANAGFKPAYQVEPRVQEMMMDIKEVQDRVNKVFFVDLFLMISSLDTVRTATEIDARREEKLVMLGPVIERFENEVLDPIIDRIFAIMARRGLFPPPPPEIAGQPVDVQYISMLAEAQRAVSTAGIERILQVAGNMAAVFPDILDNIDEDKAIQIYADRLSVEPEIIRSAMAVMQVRQRKADAQRAATAAQAGLAGVEAAQTLSKTEVGGGRNALEAMLQ